MSHLINTRSFCDENDGSPVFDGTTTILGFVPSGGTYTVNRPLVCNKLSITGTAIVRMTNGTNSTDFICARWLSIAVGASLLWSGNDASGVTAGAAISPGASLNSASGAGGNGGSNAAGSAGTGPATSAMSGAGGNGGSAGANGGGAGSTTTALPAPLQRMFRSIGFGSNFRVVSANTLVSVNGSGGGGGGGGVDNTGTGVGGGGGGGAPLGALRVGIWEVYGTVGCPGGRGADGAITGDGVAGGGGGGSGGSLWVECDILVSRGTITVAGGLPGSGAGGGNSGAAGSAGTLVFIRGGRPG